MPEICARPPAQLPDAVTGSHEHDGCGGGGRQAADHRDQVLFGQVGRLDAANGGHRYAAPRDDGAAADPYGRDLAECGQRGHVNRAGGGKGLGQCAAQRQTGEARAVQSGNGADCGFEQGDRRARHGYVTRDLVSDVI